MCLVLLYLSGAALTLATIPCPAENDTSLLPWGSPSSWPGGVVPASGDNVTLLPGMRLLLSAADAPAAAPLNLSYVEVRANATLVFATHGAAIQLRLLGMTVRGELRAGTQDCPIHSPVTIELVGEKLKLEDRGSSLPPEVKGIYVTGNGVANMHGTSVGARGWTRLASPHAANATSLLVRAGAEAWLPGGRVVITTTHFRDHLKYSENEVRTITAVNAHSGHAACVADADALGRNPGLCAVTELSLDTPLAHAHYAHEEQAAYAAEVMLLSRSLVVRGSPDSEYSPGNLTNGFMNPSLADCTEFKMNRPCADEILDGYGGHILAEGLSATLHLSNVELYRMGQTNVRGRYPVHFHMMGEAAGRASARHVAVHHSFYRCFVMHGTNSSHVQLNAAFDVVGHCFYLEDGVEERNIIEGNLAAHIHFLISPETASSAGIAEGWITKREGEGYPVAMRTAFGQFQPTFRRIAGRLEEPADVVAAGFYISNLYNYFVDNAASGGWAGIIVPSLQAPVGLHRGVDLKPNGRPALLFARNSAHSSGFWWGDAACIYFGGRAWEEEVVEGNASYFLKKYAPGRQIHQGWNPTSAPNGKTGDALFGEIWNLTVAMSLNIGLNFWSGRTTLRGLSAFDTRLGLSIQGTHHMLDIFIECRTSNEPYKWPELAPWHTEKKFWTEGMWRYGNWYPGGQYQGFSWYDQGQRHIVDGMTFKGCENATGLFVIFSGGDRAHTQVMMASMNVKYLDHNFDATPPPNNLVWWRQASDGPCQFDPGHPNNTRTLVQQQWLQQQWLDADGSTTGRGVPTLMASAFAGNWWRLDSGCERRWDLWLCDLTRRRWPVSVQLRWGQDVTAVRNKVQCGGALSGCQPLTPCPELGYVTHFGSPPGHELLGWKRRQALEGFEGVPISPNGAVTGPGGGDGWFVNMFEGAPIEMKISNIQLPEEVTRLVVAIQYPPNTSFVVESAGSPWCTDKWATWMNPAQLISECAFAHRAVDSVAQVREGRGDEFHFDGTHLYVRVLRTNGWFDRRWSQELFGYLPLEWEEDIVLDSQWRGYPYTFERSGVSLIEGACGEPTALCGPQVRIKADCAPAFLGSLFCNQTAPMVVPASCENTTFPFETCADQPPSAPLPPAPPPLHPSPQPSPPSPPLLPSPTPSHLSSPQTPTAAPMGGSGTAHTRPYRLWWSVDNSAGIETPPSVIRGDRGLPTTRYNEGNNGNVTNVYGNKGNMPKFYNGEPQNGGIPQNGSLEVHLARYRVSLNALIPEVDFQGVCMLDFEHWRADWNSSDWNERERAVAFAGGDVALARVQYEEATKRFMLATINETRALRPGCLVGWYGYPRNPLPFVGTASRKRWCGWHSDGAPQQCGSWAPSAAGCLIGDTCFFENNVDGSTRWDRLGVGAGYDTVHGPYQRALNDELSWLIEASDVIIPSIYLGLQGDRYPEVDSESVHRSYVKGTVMEARRLADNAGAATGRGAPLVLPIVWPRYNDYWDAASGSSAEGRRLLSRELSGEPTPRYRIAPTPACKLDLALAPLHLAWVGWGVNQFG